MVKELRPDSLKEALSLRRTTAAQPVAGGTALTFREDAAYLYLDGCEEFRRIDTDGKLVHIGAGCSFAQLLEEELVSGAFKAASCLCPEELLPRATLGGALCDPACAAVSALLALDASVTLASETGRRTMRLDKFYRRSGLNLASGELICEILLPEREEGTWQFLQEGEGAERVSFAAVLERSGGRLSRLGVAFGGLDTLPWRIREFEQEMLGLNNKGARALKKELLAAYDRYLPVSGGWERKERSLAWLADFLKENGI